MRHRLLATFGLICCTLLSYSQDYIAKVMGSSDWSRRDETSVSGYCVSFKNNVENSIVVQVYAYNDGHFDIDASPLGVYFSDSGTLLIEDAILPSFYISGQKYENVHYIKRKCVLQGVFANIEIWQLTNNDIEYTIIGLSPVKKNHILINFVSHNLQLLPLPEVTEDSFIQTLETVNDLIQQAGGAKMSDEIKMTSAVADKSRKEFIRTYQFYPDVTDDVVDYLTTNDATYSMVEYEVENTPLVKNAISLGYTIVVVWNDKNGELIISYTYNF